jgi:hypothetical protein
MLMWYGVYRLNGPSQLRKHSEHIGDTKSEKQWYAVEENSTETKHSAGFDRTEVSANIRTYPPVIITEAIEITKETITSTMKTDTN